MATSLNTIADTLEAKGYSLYYEPAHLDHEGAPASDALYVEVKHMASGAIALERDFVDEYYAEEALTGFIKGLDAYYNAQRILSRKQS